MSTPFIGEIKMFGLNFAPSGWAMCNGQLLPIAQNTALFSILGTTYGGDGETTLALPNLQGRFPMHPGNGPGLTPRNLGENGGEESVGLTTATMPPHTHPHHHDVSSNAASERLPTGNYSAAVVDDPPYAATGAATTTVSTTATGGGGVPHSNMPPYCAVNFCIALVGTFPTAP